jgi:hypothetical protein
MLNQDHIAGKGRRVHSENAVDLGPEQAHIVGKGRVISG